MAAATASALRRSGTPFPFAPGGQPTGKTILQIGVPGETLLVYEVTPDTTLDVWYWATDGSGGSVRHVPAQLASVKGRSVTVAHFFRMSYIT